MITVLGRSMGRARSSSITPSALSVVRPLLALRRRRLGVSSPSSISWGDEMSADFQQPAADRGPPESKSLLRPPARDPRVRRDASICGLTTGALVSVPSGGSFARRRRRVVREVLPRESCEVVHVVPEEGVASTTRREVASSRRPGRSGARWAFRPDSIPFSAGSRWPGRRRG